MLWSKLFIPTLREIPSEADAMSHALLLRVGDGVAAGILNFESSTGTLIFISVNVRVETGLPASIVELRAMNGNFTPSTSR